ncbi:UDP-N-acetylglucosamine 1-carboxyvinyltransferase [filamentous cyanobacterium LEGE 11480]|uniref:UDP-N-acetylglucosamine 1-carboxyvinyltransferase n=1 Tax=Romeriopsis navalis LEGE 11480 TaxID=2777977 RepID=A0A928VLT5_9CYAN|nr:UDP-N-acetylglucosamine 1-carboxyvinyltransferase [Romeriopsis navalis]MBE9028991.1 UDP-N-acetylglucosamine 1-carboxyvinyltransferase [Romeriopsis navalis LEGE 11480]
MSKTVNSPEQTPVLRVWGGQKLSGEVVISGAKNSALVLMAGSLLCSEACRISNMPGLADVKTMTKLLSALGLTVKRDHDVMEIDASGLNTSEAPYELVSKMRASFFIVGALLGRTGIARVPLPGGCSIGDRPVDIHVRGLQALGADVHVEHGVLHAYVRGGKKRLQGGHAYLDFPSVGATENILMAATLAEGETIIENAAREPEIVDLANFCIAMGAKIQGAGTDKIVIQGVERLHSCDYSVIPDRIEAASFLLAGAITRSEITVAAVCPEHLTPVLAKLAESGITVVADGPNRLRVIPTETYRGVDIETLPHPGFPTDVQSPFMSLLTLAEGSSVITEKLFENRLQHVAELNRMGADIRLKGSVAIVNGVARLSGAPVMATDLRASAALVIAGLAADGETVISGLHHMDRGYSDLEGKMRGLGAKLERTMVDVVSENPEPATAQ